MSDDILVKARKLAADIADDIERLGHWQGDAEDQNGCCIITSPSWREYRIAGDDHVRLTLVDALGFNTLLLMDLYNWNDTTPTEEVLAKLRAVANGD